MNEDITPQMKRAAAARHRANLARNDLLLTVEELKSRMTPGALAQSTGEVLKGKAIDGAEATRKALQSRPALTGFGAAAMGLFAVLCVRSSIRKGHSDAD